MWLEFTCESQTQRFSVLPQLGALSTGVFCSKQAQSLDGAHWLRILRGNTGLSV